MPRGGPPTYTYSLPAIYLAIPGTLITAAQHNTPLEDIATALNTAWPINLGGTGGTSRQTAINSLFDGTTYVSDEDLRIAGAIDSTKLVDFDVSALTTGTKRTLAIADASGTVITTAAATSAAGMASESAVGYVRASVVKYSPGVAKCWVHCGVSGNIFQAYNVSSVTDNGAGDVTVNQSVTMSSNNGPILASYYAAGAVRVIAIAAYTTTSFQAFSYNLSEVKADPSEWFLARYGTIT